MCGCPGTRHSWEKEGNESSRPRILTQSSPWLFPAIKESSLTFKMLGGMIFFFYPNSKSHGQTILNIPGYSPMHQLPWLAPGYSRSSVRRVNSACIIYPL